MAYTTINKSSLHFNTKLFTGTGSSNAITGVGFQPDFTWIKNRATTGNHALFDVINGVTKYVNSNTNYALQTSAQTLTAFGADGFTVGTSADLNGNGNNIASWNWKAGGAGSANTDGSINSTVSVNTTAGFSIVKFTGSGANATVGHGLGVAPKMYLLKSLGDTSAWLMYHDGLDASSPQNYRLVLNQNTARQDNTTWNDTAPTSSVFSVGSASEVNGSGVDRIVYCFAEKTGYSKFGRYDGNGSTDGNFLYTGFKPAFFIMKRYDTTGNWGLFDNKRSTSGGGNVINYWVNPDLSNAEGSSSSAMNVDFVSNGVKIREDNGDLNTSGGDYIYMAFGQSIVGSNNIPATAR